VTNYRTGHEAEKRAADFLAGKGFKVLEMNWKTRLCEIDIVAEKNGTVHLVEVKYRNNVHQGRGVDYITAKKLRQMRLAAELWVNENRWDGEYVLSAISMDAANTEFIEQI
jgi:Holliday junction resolvase-like predicted endonuclease